MQQALLIKIPLSINRYTPGHLKIPPFCSPLFGLCQTKKVHYSQRYRETVVLHP